jgi:hypothetical protein
MATTLEAPVSSEREDAVTADLKQLRDFIAHGAPGAHYYVVLLGLQVFDLTRIMDRVQRGLSYTTLERFHRNTAWGLR